MLQLIQVLLLTHQQQVLFILQHHFVSLLELVVLGHYAVALVALLHLILGR